MRRIILVAFVFLLALGCKKEDTLPRLLFSKEERNWFIYQEGQKFKFKNPTGDSVVFTVDSVRNYFRPQYEGPIDDLVETGQVEFYEAYLTEHDSAIQNKDFIYITFYKDLRMTSWADEIRESITWHKLIGQSVEIQNIENKTPFISKAINGVTYNKVTEVLPTGTLIMPWTRWKSANYDQQSGFIELIDTSGVSWLTR